MAFFSKNKETAKLRLKELAKADSFYNGKDVKLSPKQIKHVKNWKTWEIE